MAVDRNRPCCSFGNHSTSRQVLGLTSYNRSVKPSVDLGKILGHVSKSTKTRPFIFKRLRLI